jgi:hypothetical protein
MTALYSLKMKMRMLLHRQKTHSRFTEGQLGSVGTYREDNESHLAVGLEVNYTSSCPTRI